MILRCPECQTRYRADAASFPAGGRRVRCAKCGEVWHQMPPETESDSSPEITAPDTTRAPAIADAGRPASPVTAQTRQDRKPSRPVAERLGLIAGWAGLAAMILLIGWMGFRFREEIAALWPQSSSLYATFGVAVNAHGITIDDWTYHLEKENGQPVMVVTGTLVNTSARELTVPPVRITLTDDDQRELYHWNYHPPRPTLRPRESLGFQTRLSSPPPAARHLQLRFASQD